MGEGRLGGEQPDVARDPDQLLDLVVERRDLARSRKANRRLSAPLIGPSIDSFLKSMSQNLGVFASQWTVPPPTV